jgi:hypothetical protein
VGYYACKALAAIYQTTEHHIPADSNLHSHHHESLKSHSGYIILVTLQSTTMFTNTLSRQGFVCAYAPSQKINDQVHAPVIRNSQTYSQCRQDRWRTFSHDNNQTLSIQPAASHTMSEKFQKN